LAIWGKNRDSGSQLLTLAQSSGKPETQDRAAL
jgi:hypothetical protein